MIVGLLAGVLAAGIAGVLIGRQTTSRPEAGLSGTIYERFNSTPADGASLRLP